MLVQNRILTAEPQRARRKYFLFGGEPFDKFKALSKVEGISPNKNLFLQSNQRFLGLWPLGDTSDLFQQG